MRDELYLADVSVWLEVLPPGRGTPELRERMDLLLAVDVVATTGMVRLELLGVTRTQGEYRRLAELLRALHPLSVTEHTWDTACRVGFELRRRGISVPLTDLLIAAVAMEVDAVLVHADCHFDSIAHSAILTSSSDSQGAYRGLYSHRRMRTQGATWNAGRCCHDSFEAQLYHS